MIITKKALSRRTVLRGIGVSLALPLLDAMVPALTRAGQTAARPVQRYGFFYMPNGVAMNHTGVNYWKPTTVGADFEFSPILKPLEPFRNQLTVVSGLHQPLGREPRRRQRRPHPQHRLVADRHAHQAHRRLRPARRHLGRPGDRRRSSARRRRCRRSSWRFCPNSVDRRLRHRLQLRLRHHAGVGVADDAAADAEQSAAGVRAAVRRRRPGVAAARRRSRPRAASSTRRSRRWPGSGPGSGPPTASSVSDYLDVLREVERRIQQAEAKNAESPLPDYERPGDRRARAVRRPRQADVRPAVPGLPGRHHPRHHLHVWRRAARADVSGDRAERVAPRDVAPRRQSRRTWRSTPSCAPGTSSLFAYLVDKMRDTPDGDGTPARSLAADDRRRHEQRQHPLAHGRADRARRRRRRLQGQPSRRGADGHAAVQPAASTSSTGPACRSRASATAPARSTSTTCPRVRRSASARPRPSTGGCVPLRSSDQRRVTRTSIEVAGDIEHADRAHRRVALAARARSPCRHGERPAARAPLVTPSRRATPTAVRVLLKQPNAVERRRGRRDDGAALGDRPRRSRHRRACWSRAGADVKAANRYGVTPLYSAARQRQRAR